MDALHRNAVALRIPEHGHRLARAQGRIVEVMRVRPGVMAVRRRHVRDPFMPSEADPMGGPAIRVDPFEDAHVMPPAPPALRAATCQRRAESRTASIGMRTGLYVKC